MKVAVLADVHSNLPALETVLADVECWRPDQVVLAGDVINRGPRPLECLRLVEQKRLNDGWQIVRGNHEDFVIDQAKSGAPRSGPQFEIYRHSFWTYQKLNRDVSALESMPFEVSLSGPDSGTLRVVHASMTNNRDGIYPETPDRQLRKKIAPAPAVLCVGHTHRPLIRTVDNTLVVNAGAVGMPFDGDPRAAYARLTWNNSRWQAEIVRLSYDQAQTERDFFESGFIDEAGALASIMLVEFRLARSYLYRWILQYEAQVQAGELSLDDSVRDFLLSLNGYT